MNALARRMRQGECAAHEFDLMGLGVRLDPSGVMVLPGEDCLVVADLHLEKGSAFARRGMMLPPYDTAATLALLGRTLERNPAKRVVCLGDSFHDRRGAGEMPEIYRKALAGLMLGRDWIWVSGNHDPEPPAGIGGDSLDTMSIGPLTLRHEPSPGLKPGEVAGHLHPVARVGGGGRAVRSACFATDGSRMILPSFGVTTGGLNVLDRAFAGLFAPERALACVVGMTRIFPIAFGRLSPG